MYPWDVVFQGRWGTGPDWGWGLFQSGVEEALPSLTGGFAQSPQVNAINNKSCPNSTMSIHDSSGYTKGAAQIPHANAINDKSRPHSNHKHPRFIRLRRRRCPNSTSSGYAGGAAQIPLLQVTLEVLPKFHFFSAINDNDKSFTLQPQTSMILPVMPEALPKFHRQTQLMTSLPQTSTNHQVTPEMLPKFHFFRLRWRRCPNSTGEHNQ